MADAITALLEVASLCGDYAHVAYEKAQQAGQIELAELHRANEEKAHAALATLPGKGEPVTEEERPPYTPSLPKNAKWCQPGDRQDKRYFLVRFEDPDCRDRVFTDEAQAWNFYANATLSWNCWLFAAMPANPQPDAAILGKALEDIAAERERQKSVEGWTPEHDDEHDLGELVAAAVCYASPGAFQQAQVAHHYEATGASRYADDPAPDARPVGTVTVPSPWPWDGQWWKPTTTRRNLVKAGALIVADIERLDRALSTDPLHAGDGRQQAKEVDGWRTVPAEPTEEMLQAGLEALRNNLGHEAVIVRDPLFCYRYMIAAAPPVPATRSTGK